MLITKSVKKRFIPRVIFLFLWLTSCQPAPLPPPVTASLNEEFILRPGQSAAISNTGVSVQLIAITGDERCPLNMECAMSGPVTLTISVQKEKTTEFTLQTFTDNNGRAPEITFKGIQDRIELETYIIQVKSVSPYPLDLSAKIKDSEYQASFVMTSK